MCVSSFSVKTVLSYSRLNWDSLNAAEGHLQCFPLVIGWAEGRPKMLVATVTPDTSRVFPQPLYAAVNHSFSRFAGRTYIVTFKYTTCRPPSAPGSISGCPTLHSPGVRQAHFVEDWPPLLSAGYLKTLHRPAFPFHQSPLSLRHKSAAACSVSRSRGFHSPVTGASLDTAVFVTVRELKTFERDATPDVLCRILLMDIFERGCNSSLHDLDSNQKQVGVSRKVLFQPYKHHLHNCFSKNYYVSGLETIPVTNWLFSHTDPNTSQLHTRLWPGPVIIRIMFLLLLFAWVGVAHGDTVAYIVLGRTNTVGLIPGRVDFLAQCFPARAEGAATARTTWLHLNQCKLHLRTSKW